mmetsp:Transcript_17195/g.23637  ORF Transcript_17195/g.23637 Transcript_17195/m.23637 type:complete len:80 (-) Transcript_17195:86-325(-)
MSVNDNMLLLWKGEKVEFGLTDVFKHNTTVSGKIIHRQKKNVNNILCCKICHLDKHSFNDENGTFHAKKVIAISITNKN